MSLELFLHPLSSYCHKVLIALYENDTPFEVKRVDDPAVAGEWEALSPLGNFRSFATRSGTRSCRNRRSSSSTWISITRARTGLIPRDPDLAWQVRLRDRFFDNYLHAAMQTFAGDLLRPQEKRDPYGVDQAKAMFVKALGVVDAEMAHRTWAMGDTFTMADCAAAPAHLLREPLLRAVPADASQRPRLSRPADGAALLCARAGRGEALHATCSRNSGLAVRSSCRR